MTFLADTSMVIRLRRGRQIDARWVDAVRAGLVGVCPVVEAELVRATDGKNDRDDLRRLLDGLFGWHPMPDDAWGFVARAQETLADLGQHQGPSVADLLVAATRRSAADAWGLTVLHVDADFDTIARVLPLQVRRADKTWRCTTAGH